MNINSCFISHNEIVAKMDFPLVDACGLVTPIEQGVGLMHGQQSKSAQNSTFWEWIQLISRCALRGAL